MDKAAVVILNWNGEKFLRKYLPALVANTPGTRPCPQGEAAVSIVVSSTNL